MSLLLPMRFFDLSRVSNHDVCDLVNWIAFSKHRPNDNEEDVWEALPHILDHNPFMESSIQELVKVSYELLEDYYIMGTYLDMTVSGRFFLIERCVCKNDQLDEGFLRNFEKDD